MSINYDAPFFRGSQARSGMTGAKTGSRATDRGFGSANLDSTIEETLGIGEGGLQGLLSLVALSTFSVRPETASPDSPHVQSMVGALATFLTNMSDKNDQNFISLVSPIYSRIKEIRATKDALKIEQLGVDDRTYASALLLSLAPSDVTTMTNEGLQQWLEKPRVKLSQIVEHLVKL